MAYRIDKNTNELVMDGWEKGISASPYDQNGVANIRNMNTSYYPGVAYVNYRRQSATLGATWYAGTHSTDVSNNVGWEFTSVISNPMDNPVQHCVSPAGLIYILDASGQIWKQSSVNSSTFNVLEPGTGRLFDGATGIAYWNDYLVVFGDQVIEFCGDGSGDAGIIETNWNVQGTFASLTTTWVAQTFQCTGAIAGGATSATLSYNWPYATNTNATLIFSNGDTRTGNTVTNGSTALSWTGGLSGGGASSLVFISSPGLALPANKAITAGNQIVFSTTGTLPSPLVAGTTYYATGAPALSNEGNYCFSVSATPGGTAIILNSQGTGVHTLTLQAISLLPLGNVNTFTFSAAVQGGATSAAIGSYVDPRGVTQTPYWYFPTGVYNMIDGNGNNILATLTFSSGTVLFSSPIVAAIPAGTNITVQIMDPSVTLCRAYTSKVDGNLYFINGQSMGSLIIAETNTLFTPGNPLSYAVEYSTFALSTGSNRGADSITDMTDLQSSMIVSGQEDVYVWDYVSAFTNSPVPIGETIHRIWNLLNNIYILAGQKGSIYTSNGAYAQFLYKIPDYISGVIDPIWTFGGVMTHRARLFFQALAKDTSGNNLLAGIFSLIVSPSLLGETATGVVMDSQNSAGLIPAAGATGAGVLISAEPSSSGQNSYYSSYSTGASSGLIDYNDTSLWQNGEPMIETDIVPVGTILEKKTLGNFQFKLDRPMATGDSISLYWRSSLTDSYTLMGTTTTAVLADYMPSNVNQAQWAQFKATFTCASSGSSRIPIREVRVQLN